MTHKLFLLVLINLSLIGTLVAGLPALAQETPVPYTISNPVPYNDGDPAQAVTLYLPEAASRKPLTLFLPYGQYFPELTDYFAGRGYTVLSVDLRENGDFLMEMQDTLCALAWAYTHAETYGFAPAQLVLVGGSMHGGLMALLTMIDDATPYLEECPHVLPENRRVQGVVALAVVFDYSQEADFFAGFIDTISAGYMGSTPTENPARWAEASAITWIDGNEPSFLLVHGGYDTNVDIHQSQIFAAALEEAGVDVEFVPIPRATHSSIIRDNEAFAIMETFLERIAEQLLVPLVPAATIGKIAFISQRDGNDEIYVMNPDGSDQQRLTFNKGRDFVSSWSPDGTQLVYGNDGDGDWEIYMMNADGSNPRRLTDNTAKDWTPAWSPDGTQIAFSSDRDGNDEIYLMDTDGGNVRRLTELGGSDTDPAWSPDGRELVFTSSKDGTPDIYVMTLENGEIRRLTDDSAYDGCPAFSPDGSRIVYMSQRQGQFAIYLVNTDGSGPQALNIGDGDGWCPSWSPDGNQIAFYSYRPGAYRQGKSNAIFVVNVDGTNLQQLTETGLFSFHPRWWHPPADSTPAAAGGNHDRIIFYSERDGRGNGEIYTMNPDGSDQQRLTFNKTDESSPVWSPDGTQVVFISDRNDAHPIACFPTCNYDLYVMDADGSNQRQLTDTPYVESHPDWSPADDRVTFDADPDGDGKNAIYVISPDGGEPYPLSDGSADDCWGDWSLDAASIVFSSNRDGNYELYIMNPDGSNVRQLTHTPDLNETFPDWSPDGTQLLFFSYPTRGQRQDIYVINADGTNFRQLTDSPRIVDEAPIWSPDGMQIVFQSDRDGNFELYIMNADGSNVRRLTNNRAGDYWPSW